MKRAAAASHEPHRAEHRDRPRLDRRLPGRAASTTRTGASCRSTSTSARESFKDGVDLTAREFYERLRTSPELPTTSQPTPGDFLAAYEELGAYERILSIHIAANLSGTFQSAGTAAAELGDGRVRTIDSESASVAIAMLATRDPAPARARHDRRGGRRARRALPRASTGCSSPSTRSSSSRAAAASGEAKAFAGQLMHVKPILSIRDGEVLAGEARARQPQGVPGVRRRARDEHARRAGAARRHRARRRAGADAPSSRRWCATAARRRRSRWRRCSAP